MGRPSEAQTCAASPGAKMCIRDRGKGDHQQGQGGEEVYGLGLGGSLGRVGLGLGPILDGRFGGGVQAGVLVARVEMCIRDS